MSRINFFIVFILVSGFCSVFGQEKEQLLADCGGESYTYGVLKNDLSAELIDYSIERECIADSVIREGINSKYQIIFDTITKKFVRK